MAAVDCHLVQEYCYQGLRFVLQDNCSMKVSSFIRIGAELVPVEAELNLLPGLPQIHFLGLPDLALKESALRIRSALREQGFHLPQAQQILVHLRPSHIRKSSRGLDLAVAAALLWETGQIQPPNGEGIPRLYGELSLKGNVAAPDDVEEIDLGSEETLYTGATPHQLPFATLQIKELADLATPIRREAESAKFNFIRPNPTASTFPKQAAEAAMVIAAGEHSALLAGPSGSGKSTLAAAIPAWLEAPAPDMWRKIRRQSHQSGQKLTWRPVQRPHHSITSLGMIGGGMSLWSGEITRAHTGVLILDELLEFNANIQDALREPIETGSISIVRGGSAKNFPAHFLLLATTNLCRCGHFVPRREAMDCRCRRSDRERALSRLSGPMVDRFAVFEFTHEWHAKGEVVASDAIALQVSAAIDFRKRRGQIVANGSLSAELIESGLSDFQRKHLLFPSLASRRRRVSLLRVARTLADLRCSEKVGDPDLERAFELTIKAHLSLEQWRH